MAVRGVLRFENCSTRSNLKIVKTEIDLNSRIEFWEKSNFGHFAIFRLFFLIHFLMYFLTYFLSVFLYRYMYVEYVEVNSYLNFFG